MLKCGCSVLRYSNPSQILLPGTRVLQKQYQLTTHFDSWGSVSGPPFLHLYMDFPTPSTAIHSYTCYKAEVDLELLVPCRFLELQGYATMLSFCLCFAIPCVPWPAVSPHWGPEKSLNLDRPPWHQKWDLGPGGAPQWDHCCLPFATLLPQAHSSSR